MKNKLFLLVCVLSLFLLLCSCGDKTPTESDIKRDLPEFSDGTYVFKDCEISKMKVLEGSADCWVNATFENDMYQITTSIEMTYEYYEKGGWILDKSSEYYNYNYTAMAAYNENCAYDDLYNNGYDTLELTDHKTDLENNKDTFTFTFSKDKEIYSEEGTVNVEYEFSISSGWSYDSDNLTVESEKKLNLSGTWEYYTAPNNWYILYSFEKCDNLNVTISEYRVDTLEYSYSVQHYDRVATISEDCIYIGDLRLDLEDETLFYNQNDVELFEDDGDFENLDDKDNIGSYYEVTYTGDLSDAVKIPDLIGCKCTEAVMKLQDAGFVVSEFSYDYGNYVNEDIEIDSNNYSDKKGICTYLPDKKWINPKVDSIENDDFYDLNAGDLLGKGTIITLLGDDK